MGDDQGGVHEMRSPPPIDTAALVADIQSEVARRRDVVPGQICRWRNELWTAAAGFAEVAVAPEPSERSRTDVPVLEIELGRDIRVRVAPTAPKDLVSAIIKALAAR